MLPLQWLLLPLPPARPMLLLLLQLLLLLSDLAPPQPSSCPDQMVIGQKSDRP